MKTPITIQPEELANLVAYLETCNFKMAAPVMQFLQAKIEQAKEAQPKEALMPTEAEGQE